MRLVRSVLLSAVLSTLLTPAALAAEPPPVTVSITATGTPTAITVGESARIAGTSSTAAVGSDVVLQRRRGDEWLTVAETSLDEARAYAFTVTPRRGRHRFRVVLPPQRGQSRAVSPWVDLTARTQPTLSLRLRWIDRADGERRLRASGASSHLRPSVVQLQVRGSDGSWQGLGISHMDQGRFVQVLAVAQGDDTSVMPGSVVRATLPERPLRLPARSTSVVPDPDPLVLTLNDPEGLRSPELASFTDVSVDVPAGSFVTLHASAEELLDDVLAPDGSPVDVTLGQESSSFTAVAGGRYTIRAGGFHVYGLWASTPKVIDAELDLPLEVQPDVNGQLVDVAFTGSAGTAVTFRGWTEGAELLTEGGEPVPAWLEPRFLPAVYRLPADGTYRLRLPDIGYREVAIWSAVQEESAVDGPAVPVTVDNPEAVGIVALDNPGRLPFFVPTGRCTPGPAWWTLIDPRGRESLDVWQVPEPEAGTYLLVLRGDPSVPTSVVSAKSPTAVTLDPGGAPQALATGDQACEWFRGSFDATAGQALALRDTAFDLEEFSISGPGGIAPWEESWYHVWVMPESGTYTFSFLALPSWSDELSLETWPVTELTPDGSPVNLAAGDPTALPIVHIDAPVGAVVRIDVDPGPLAAWGTHVHAPGSAIRLANLGSTTAATATLTVTEPGGVYVDWLTNLSGQTVTMTATVL